MGFTVNANGVVDHNPDITRMCGTCEILLVTADGEYSLRKHLHFHAALQDAATRSNRSGSIVVRDHADYHRYSQNDCATLLACSL